MARFAVFACLLAVAAGANVVANDWAELKMLCEAGGNVVTLSGSFDASEYAEQIDFSGVTCVVKGQGQTLDAKGVGRFFYGSGAGSSLELHGVILKNGNSQSVPLVDSPWGQIYIKDGGAIYIKDGTLIIHDSTFDTNHAPFYGGAIYADGSGVKLEIHDTSFVSNSAGYGGAITAGEGDVRIFTTTFESNAANMQGGAIYAASADFKIYTSTFDTNTAYYSAEFGTLGNDIYLNAGTVVFKGCTSSGELAEIQMTSNTLLPDITSFVPCPTDAPTKAPTDAPTSEGINAAGSTSLSGAVFVMGFLVAACLAAM